MAMPPTTSSSAARVSGPGAALKLSRFVGIASELQRSRKWLCKVRTAPKLGAHRQHEQHRFTHTVPCLLRQD